MKKINKKLYFLENKLKTNNKIRKSIILKKTSKYDTLFLSIIIPILNNLIKGMNKVDFNKAKSENYDLEYDINFRKINNNIILNLTISFIDLSLLDNDNILNLIEDILKGLTYNFKDLENAILDYENFLNSLEDQKDKFIKVKLNDQLFINDENYLTFKEKIEFFKSNNILNIENFIKEIDLSNNYFVFEGKKESFKQVKLLLDSLNTKEELNIIKGYEKNINQKKEVIEDIRNENQVSLSLNYQADISIKDEHKLKILSYIFGRGVYSKLFMNVREKKSLCYSIYSVEDIRYGIDVFTGVDFLNKDEAIKEIKKQFKNIQKGNFLKEFELAKKQYYSEVLYNKDNYEIQNNYLDKNIIYETDYYTTNNILIDIDKISFEDIKNFSNKFELKKVIVLN